MAKKSQYNGDMIIRQGHSQSGQIALIVLLIMVVGLTIGLSLASRTVLDVSLTRQDEEGTATFQAAESGIEDALSQDLENLQYVGDQYTVSDLDYGNSDVTYTVARRREVETRVDQGGAVQVDVTGAADGNELEIHWARGGTCSGSPSQNSAALLIRVYKSDDTARNYAVRGFGCSDATYPNSFPAATLAGLNGYHSQYRVPLEFNDQIVSIHPVYNDTTFYVTGRGFQLPVQYYAIRSEAANQEGDETRVIQVTRTVPGHPGILDFTLYSGTSLNK